MKSSKISPPQLFLLHASAVARFLKMRRQFRRIAALVHKLNSRFRRAIIRSLTLLFCMPLHKQSTAYQRFPAPRAIILIAREM
jgi:hypothetical protein